MSSPSHLVVMQGSFPPSISIVSLTLLDLGSQYSSLMAKMLLNINNTTISLRLGHYTLKESGMKVVTKQKGLTLSQNIGEGG